MGQLPKFTTENEDLNSCGKLYWCPETIEFPNEIINYGSKCQRLCSKVKQNNRSFMQRRHLGLRKKERRKKTNGVI